MQSTPNICQDFKKDSATGHSHSEAIILVQTAQRPWKTIIISRSHLVLSISLARPQYWTVSIVPLQMVFDFWPQLSITASCRLFLGARTLYLSQWSSWPTSQQGPYWSLWKNRDLKFWVLFQEFFCLPSLLHSLTPLIPSFSGQIHHPQPLPRGPKRHPSNPSSVRSNALNTRWWEHCVDGVWVTQSWTPSCFILLWFVPGLIFT